MENNNAYRIIEKIFEVKISTNELDEGMEKLCDWDSYDMMMFTAELEKITKKEISIYDVVKIQTIRELVQFIEGENICS